MSREATGGVTDISNRCRLCDGNEDLMRDAGVEHPDGVSMRIIETVWGKILKDNNCQ